MVTTAWLRALCLATCVLSLHCRGDEPADPGPATSARGDRPGDAGGARGTASAAARSYTLRPDALAPPDESVAVTAQVPGGWTETLDAMGSPTYRAPGVRHGPSLVLLQVRGDDDAARLTRAIGLQYDDAELATATRDDRADGRVWIAHARADGHVHARMFIPATAAAGVVMCVVLLFPDEAKRLDALSTFCDSVGLAR